MDKIFSDSLISLTEYCINEDFKGYDPYDGLNSSLFRAIPFFINNRLPRLIWIQFFKKSIINFRPVLGISKEYNPKALGLFLSGYCNLYKVKPEQDYLEKIRFLTNEIKAKISPDWSGACWGYNFDWQSRAFFLPKFTPTVVATSFISSALLDAYEIVGEKEILKIVRSSCEFILNDLKRTYDENGNFVFSYSPLDRAVVYNASLLGSRLLSKVYSITRETELIKAAESSVSFCCNVQKPDGSWTYGSSDFHKWIDNFHTGFNLECISDYIKHTGDIKYQVSLDKGFDYYIKTFFTGNGIPKYYNNSVYPVDIHSSAQLIITLSRLGRIQEYKELADKVLHWTVDNMQSAMGYFYFQKNRIYTTKIPYMRWAQAWMFYALSEYRLKCS